MATNGEAGMNEERSASAMLWGSTRAWCVFAMAWLMLSTLAIAAQTPATKPQAAPQKPSGAAAKESAPAQTGATKKTTPVEEVEPDEGSIEGRLYKSDYFRFSYTLPVGFTVDEEFIANTEESETTFVLLAAENEFNEAGERSAIVLLADKPVAEITTATQYMQKVATEIAKNQGFETLQPPREVVIHGRTWARADFRKNTTYQTTMVTMARGFAVGFNLAAPSEAGLKVLTDSVNTMRFAAMPSSPAAKP